VDSEDINELSKVTVSERRKRRTRTKRPPLPELTWLNVQLPTEVHVRLKYQAVLSNLTFGDYIKKILNPCEVVFPKEVLEVQVVRTEQKKPIEVDFNLLLNQPLHPNES
jgi:hypothetical protein